MDQLSEFPEPVDASPQDNPRFQNLLKDLFVAEYLPCLTHEDLDTLYDSDVIPLPDIDTEESQNSDQVSDSPGKGLSYSRVAQLTTTRSRHHVDSWLEATYAKKYRRQATSGATTPSAQYRKPQ